jgi:hypothetical protein
MNQKNTKPNSDGLINCLCQPWILHRDTKRSSTYRDFAKNACQLIKPPGRQTV